MEWIETSQPRHVAADRAENRPTAQTPRSRSSNSDGVTVPAASSFRIVGARSVVIQRSPSTPARSSRIRAAVSMPRSPTSTTRCKPKRVRSLSTWQATVFGSLVEPSKTSTATGQPAAVHNRPKTICKVPCLPSRLCPRCANGQWVPSR